MADDPTAILAAIRDRAGVFAKLGPPRPALGFGSEVYNAAIASAEDAPSLLAAIEAVLKLHQPGPVTIIGTLCKRHSNHRYFSITSTEAEDVRACQDCEAMVYRSCSGCGHPAPVDMCPVREAIRAALARTGLSEDEGHG